MRAPWPICVRPAQRDVAPQLRVDADLDVGLDDRRGGVAEGDVRLQRAVDAPAQRRLGLGELLAIVDAAHVLEGGLDRRDADAARRARDDVGQIILALRVARAETERRLAEEVGRPAVDPRVDLGDGALVGRRVLLLDDADHVPALVAQDAAVAGGVGRRRRDQRQAAVAARRPDQLLQRLAAQERNVAVEDQDHPVRHPRQRRHRQQHGVTGAPLLGLLDDGDGAGAEAREQRRLDRLVLVAEHRDDGIGAERARELDRITDQRAAEQLVQHLRARRTHARPLPRREHDRGEWTLGGGGGHRGGEVKHEPHPSRKTG